MVSKRELRSLGIETPGTQTIPLDGSIKKRRKKMSGPIDCFADFSAKIRHVVNSPDRDGDAEVVLRALRDLAEERRTSILGQVVDPLDGLGQQKPADTPNSDYCGAMKELLLWGIQNFPIDPASNAAVNGMDLWKLMSELDSPGVYNQRLFPFSRTSFDRGPGVFCPSVASPQIITDVDCHPIREFSPERVPYVVDYLRQEPSARAILATSCKFGWHNLWVQCICLYVDADNTQDLVASVSTQSTPTIIFKGRLEDTSGNVDTVSRLMERLEPPGMEASAISARKANLRKNPTVRAVTRVTPFVHGQSISLMGKETKGSVAVFLSPENNESRNDDHTRNDKNMQQAYALTACHVLPPDPAGEKGETRVITPGGMDILTLLLRNTRSPQPNQNEIDLLIQRWETPCGEVMYRHIGVNKNGWRSDWALVCLKEEWRGANGNNIRELSEEFWATERSRVPRTGFCGFRGLIRAVDPMGGAICYKDGATTAYTAGRIGEEEVLMFRKGDTTGVTEQEIKDENLPPDQVVCARVLLVHPIIEEGLPSSAPPYIAWGGDSGCGVFCPAIEENGWTWGGQLLGVFNPDGRPPAALMIPQSEILDSIKEVTGKSWKLST